ncbi:hypothetical protein J3F83DRAFT_727115 [Trichoderma novae-zelandiae]
MQRTAIREKYHLAGGWCGDFCRSGCCTCCVLIQNQKEMEEQGPFSQPYRSTGPIMYSRTE